MRRQLFHDEHDEFRSSFRRFVEADMVPRSDEWDEAGIVDRSASLPGSDLGDLVRVVLGRE